MSTFASITVLLNLEERLHDHTLIARSERTAGLLTQLRGSLKNGPGLILVKSKGENCKIGFKNSSFQL